MDYTRLLIRSILLVIFVMRIPYFSFLTSTIPFAIKVLFASISTGSPSRVDRETAEPGPISSSSCIGIFLRPSSTVISRGISRITSRFTAPLTSFNSPASFTTWSSNDWLMNWSSTLRPVCWVTREKGCLTSVKSVSCRTRSSYP